MLPALSGALKKSSSDWAYWKTINSACDGGAAAMTNGGSGERCRFGIDIDPAEWYDVHEVNPRGAET